MNERKDLFKIPLINIWYVIITLIFILMQVTNIINWSPLWILSPLWLPWAISFGIIFLIYIIKGIVYAVYWFKSSK